MAQTHSLDLERGSSQYAITGASPTGLNVTGSFTLEAWVKLESQPSSALWGIMGKYKTSGGRAYDWYYRDDAGTKKFGLDLSDDGSSSSGYEITISGGLPTAEWVHIAITFTVTSGAMEAFVNGKSVGTNTHSKKSIASTSAKFCVGASQEGGDQYFDGLIKDVRVFSDKRTQAEIVADAGTESVSDGNLVGEWNFNNSYADTSGNGNTLTPTNSPVFATDFPWDATAIDGSTNLETSLQAYYSLDEASGDRADSTANGNDLSDRNTVGSGTGIRENAADFEKDNNEYLRIAGGSQTGLNITGDFSASFWIKPETLGGAYQALVWRTDTSNRGYFIVLADGSEWGSYQDKLLVDFVNSSNQASRFVADTAISPTGTWRHCVIAVDVSVPSAKFFVDGVQLGSTTLASAATSIKSQSVYFQLAALENGTPGAYYDGMMDEVAIYSRTLNYGDVANLYNRGAALPFVGSVDTNDERSAVTTGSIDVNDERDAKLHGVDTTNDSRSAKTHGTSTANDSRSAKTTGQDSSSDSRSAETHGVDTTNDERAAKAHGSQSDNDARSAKVTGQDTANASRSAKVSGTATDNDARSAKVHGQAATDDSRAAKTHGTDTANDSRAAKTDGKASVTSGRNAKTHGTASANDSRSAEVHGSQDDNDARNAKTTGIATTNDSRSAKVHGEDSVNSNRDAKTTGAQGANDARSAKTHGADSINDARTAKTTGEATASDSRSAKTDGTSDTSSNRAAKTHGANTDNDSRSAEVYGVLGANDTRAAKTTGSLESQDTRSAKTTGTDTAQGSRNAKVTGVDATVSNRNAKTDGQSSANASRSAKLTGEQQMPYCPTTSPYTAKTTPYTPYPSRTCS